MVTLRVKELKGANVTDFGLTISCYYFFFFIIIFFLLVTLRVQRVKRG